MAKNHNNPKTSLRLALKGQALNERGDTTLLFVLSVVILSSLMILLTMHLDSELKLLKKRKELFLCTKETKGELKNFLTFMGRTNWGIKNAKRVSVLAIWFPPLAASADNAKKILKGIQGAGLIAHLNSLRQIKSKGCPLDPRIFITPFELGADLGFSRSLEEAAKLRSSEWSYYFIDFPYTLEVKVNADGLERILPKMEFTTSEKGAMLSSLLSSR